MEEIKTSYGGNSDMCVNLSQTHAEYEETVKDNLFSTSNNVYKEGLLVYEEMIRSCLNRKAFDECLNLMR